jgi:RimJ/RimL family protein N-acetyltransferase
MKPETIETPGARLRLVRDDDAADIEAACNDADVRRFLPSLPQPYTRYDALRFVRDGATEAWATGGGIYAIADPATDRLLGTIGVHHVDTDRAQGEIGYWVAPWARGRGVATLSLRLLAGWTFERLGVRRLELTCGPDNAASARVAERCGFVREGVLRSHLRFKGGRRDTVLFSLLPGELT